MPSGVYPRVKKWKRPDRATADKCPDCGVELVDGENWLKRKDGTKRCRACNTLRAQAYYRKNPERVLERTKRYYAKIRVEAFAAYGNACACCGESRPEFLTIDHIDGRGAEHRKKVGGGSQILQWLQQRGYPKDNYRLLCWNCNCAKGTRGGCPHDAEPPATSFPWLTPRAA